MTKGLRRQNGMADPIGMAPHDDDQEVCKSSRPRESETSTHLIPIRSTFQYVDFALPIQYCLRGASPFRCIANLW
jgi:hypothetical protein